MVIFRHRKNQPPGRIFSLPVIGDPRQAPLFFVIFGLDPEIQGKRSPYNPVRPNILDSRFRGTA